MKGREAFRSLLARNLLYLYEGPRDLQKPLGQEFFYTYMKGRETFRSLLDRNLLYLYEGPRDLQKPLGQEFVIPI